MNRKNIIVWTLYDFANSIVMIVFFLYFSQWLVVERGVSDFAYNMLYTVGSLMLLFTSPVLGSIADRTGRELTYLIVITLLTIFFFLCTTWTALFLPQRALLAAFFFLMANYFYQFSFVFYNALLHHLAPRQQWGRISGIGQAGNWLGQIAGLLITLPFAAGTIYLFGAPGRAQTFLPAIILFFVLALPMLLFFRHPKQGNASPPIKWRGEYRSQWKQLRELLKAPGMGLFLLGYFFFNDAIITASNNFPIYLQNVFAVSDGMKSLLLIGILFTSAIGALVSGWVADRIGLKKALLIVLGSWVVVFPLMSFVQSFAIFTGLSIVMGFLFGSIWTITRAVMTALCPPHTVNFGFSYYTLAERVSTLVGPVTWGLITSSLTALGPLRYRIAIGAMGGFVALGLWVVRKVRIPNNGALGGI